jgi:hypothetical protein
MIRNIPLPEAPRQGASGAKRFASFPSAGGHNIANRVAAPQDSRRAWLPDSELIVCHRCMRWHLPPMCRWDCGTLCPSCGKPRGYRADDCQPDDGRCWRCWEALL